MLKHSLNIFHVILNGNSIVQHIIQITNGILINVNVSLKSVISAKKIMAGILAHVFVTIVSI